MMVTQWRKDILAKGVKVTKVAKEDYADFIFQTGKPWKNWLTFYNNADPPTLMRNIYGVKHHYKIHLKFEINH